MLSLDRAPTRVAVLGGHRVPPPHRPHLACSQSPSQLLSTRCTLWPVSSALAVPLGAHASHSRIERLPLNACGRRTKGEGAEGGGGARGRRV